MYVCVFVRDTEQLDRDAEREVNTKYMYYLCFCFSSFACQ